MNFKTEYAIKIITKQSTLDMEDKLKRELTIMNKIKQNSYCVSLRDISQSEYHIYIVMEYCQIGDLFQFKQKYPSLTESKQFIKDILCAIEYLHGQNIVHRDIKPENIFVSRSSTNKEYSFKLGDFGEAECLQDNRVSTLRGTPQFMAPELLLSEGKPVAAKETDLWSFGGTVYTYFTDTLLWQVQEGQDSYLEGLKKAVQKAHGVVDCSDITSPTLVDFLQRMLQVEPSNRATPQELQQHPFLSDQEVITEEEEDLGI
uniref:Protein kinase domain-containing protein n=1 Tax=Arcella intermedia TaxID=1963864 RepID=A0A6B2LBV7_9EUKA